MKKRVSLVMAIGVLSSLIGCSNSTSPPVVSKPAAETPTVTASASPAAVDAVSGFYKRYLAAFAKGAATPDIAMSKAFKADIQKNEQACKGFKDEPCGWGSDANPYFNSQDTDTNLNFKNSGVRFTQAKPDMVQVDLNVAPSAAGGVHTTILFKMVQENGQWVADDILYPDGTSTYSTRKGLAEERAGLADLTSRNAKGEVVEADAFRMGKGCPKVGSVKSPLPSKPARTVTFVNKIAEDRAATIYWLNPDGEPVESDIFGDNGKVDIDTNDGAVFVVKDFDGTCYGGTHTIAHGQTEVIVK